MTGLFPSLHIDGNHKFMISVKGAIFQKKFYRGFNMHDIIKRENSEFLVLKEIRSDLPSITVGLVLVNIPEAKKFNWDLLLIEVINCTIIIISCLI